MFINLKRYKIMYGFSKFSLFYYILLLAVLLIFVNSKANLIILSAVGYVIAIFKMYCYEGIFYGIVSKNNRELIFSILLYLLFVILIVASLFITMRISFENFLFVTFGFLLVPGLLAVYSIYKILIKNEKFYEYENNLNN